MATYLTPGIYRTRPQRPPRLRRVRTDVPGFVGFCERGPLPQRVTDRDEAMKAVVRLTSWPEFVTTFGGYITGGYLAYAVRAFFENGGDACHVVRVAATEAPDLDERPRRAGMVLPFAELAPVQAARTQHCDPGDRELDFDDPTGLADGQLLALEHGVTDPVGTQQYVTRTLEYATIERVADEGRKVVLSSGLRYAFPADGTVRRFATALEVRARSAGGWGNRIRLIVTPLETGDAIAEFSLLVRVEPGRDRTREPEEEFYRRLSLDPGSLYGAATVVNSRSNLVELTRGPLGATLTTTVGPLTQGTISLAGGRDGLRAVGVRDFSGGIADFRGLRLLEEIDEVAILAVPDAVFQPEDVLPARPAPPRDPCGDAPDGQQAAAVSADPTSEPPGMVGAADGIYRSAISQCERLTDRVVLVDSPADQRPRAAVAWRERFHTRFGALYYPWLQVEDPLETVGLTRPVPPSGHIAGIYARIDRQYGVERPPANAPIAFATGVVEVIDSRQQESLNPFGVNALRTFPGRGIRVWGARSLAGPSDGDWRFIHVRRLMSMIEESVDEASQWAVFEAHDDALRRSVQHSLSLFLEGIWRRGGLQGARPEEGFYVKCDETNNPPAVVDAGQLICEVGVAVAAPMEFLVFELLQAPSGASITER
ncbi:MAG: phage tail sheath subtilisin-like domain-containing protein [Gemmatimonadota bacterium]|jgi:phage tail sheath protein FI